MIAHPLQEMLTIPTVEVLGYAARVVSAENVTSKKPYVIQFCLIILAPVLMAGVIYVIFGRLVYWVVPPESRTIKFLWVPRKPSKLLEGHCDLKLTSSQPALSL